MISLKILSFISIFPVYLISMDNWLENMVVDSLLFQIVNLG